MARPTVSGHPVRTGVQLRTAAVPGAPGVRLRTARAALPLFLNLAKRANRQVHQLSTRDTWSYTLKAPAAGEESQISDHAGWAIDLWAAGIGAHTWPARMSPAQAKTMRRIVASYRTPDGRRVFGWGAHVSLGGDYTQTKNNDPMHVFVRPGITAADLRAVRKARGIGRGGQRRRVRAA